MIRSVVAAWLSLVLVVGSRADLARRPGGRSRQAGAAEIPRRAQEARRTQEGRTEEGRTQGRAKKDEPKKDEPKKDEPKKDEPKKDEPKKDEPKKDEPKKEEAKKADAPGTPIGATKKAAPKASQDQALRRDRHERGQERPRPVPGPPDRRQDLLRDPDRRRSARRCSGSRQLEKTAGRLRLRRLARWATAWSAGSSAGDDILLRDVKYDDPRRRQGPDQERRRGDLGRADHRGLARQGVWQGQGAGDRGDRAVHRRPARVQRRQAAQRRGRRPAGGRSSRASRRSREHRDQGPDDLPPAAAAGRGPAGPAADGRRRLRARAA